MSRKRDLRRPEAVETSRTVKSREKTKPARARTVSGDLKVRASFFLKILLWADFRLAVRSFNSYGSIQTYRDDPYTMRKNLAVRSSQPWRTGSSFFQLP
ncbi:hypothetical protein QS257_17065 [Terrilactibacillus sp. S3-3]|nr:hypothetical protein QS257_17065 [Terrilactibacillus sp. S3-3]